jgi:hypothetical protein
MKMNPRLALVVLVAVFLLAFVLSIHTLNYTGPTTFLQGAQSPQGGHVVFVHFVGGSGNVTGANYASHPCLNHN